MSEAKVIHSHVFDPTNSVFKVAANARAELHQIICTHSEHCDLHKLGRCVHRRIFSICPYGRCRGEIGPTKRARNFREWIKERKKQDVYLNPPEEKLARVGDYIYVPYNHALHALETDREARIYKQSPYFLCVSEWTLDTIIKIVQYVPQDYYCRERKEYQRETVPKFLLHLREFDPALYQELIEKHPEYDKAPNHVGRKAYLHTLKPPFTFSVGRENDVHWEWDGQKATTNSEKVYSKIRGDIRYYSDLKLTLTPTDKTVIVVQSNDWVTSDTIFID